MDIELGPTPRLVVLNSCSSGQTGTQDLFSGTAAALARSGISAVAAMQFAVSDTAAIAFARGFYTAIAHGRAVDEAASSGRISILGTPRSLEWITPVLYVRGDVSQLFTLTAPSAAGRARALLATATGAPPTRVVAKSGGHHTTITAAITASAPGDRILIKPGEYDESLTIDSDLQIRGDGRVEEITVRSADASVMSLRAAGGQITNLTIRQTATRDTQPEEGEPTAALQIEGGQPVVQDCDISCDAGCGIMIRANADPTVRANRIHDNKQSGVFVREQGRGTFEDNDISANTYSGVRVNSGGDPTVRANRIRNNRSSGISVSWGGRGTLTGNTIVSNTPNNLKISFAATVKQSGNRTSD